MHSVEDVSFPIIEFAIYTSSLANCPAVRTATFQEVFRSPDKAQLCVRHSGSFYTQKGESMKGESMTRKRLMLLVEDNNDDALLLERVVAKAELELDLRRVHNGQEAIDYLLGEGQFSDRSLFPSPDVIMLDLKMPICDGFDFLDWKRAQTRLASLPTIIMTSSNLPRDIRRGYELGAHSFTMKVKTTDSLSQRVEALRHWWFEHCVLPQDVSALPSSPT